MSLITSFDVLDYLVGLLVDDRLLHLFPVPAEVFRAAPYLEIEVEGVRHYMTRQRAEADFVMVVCPESGMIN